MRPGSPRVEGSPGETPGLPLGQADTGGLGAGRPAPPPQGHGPNRPGVPRLLVFHPTSREALAQDPHMRMQESTTGCAPHIRSLGGPGRPDRVSPRALCLSCRRACLHGEPHVPRAPAWTGDVVGQGGGAWCGESTVRLWPSSPGSGHFHFVRKPTWPPRQAVTTSSCSHGTEDVFAEPVIPRVLVRLARSVQPVRSLIHCPAR